MKRTMILAILLVACAVGVGVNAFTVITRERALARDATWRFRIDGYDPLDPFRGRYIEFTTPDLLAIDEAPEGDVDAAVEVEVAGNDGEIGSGADAEDTPDSGPADGYPPWLVEGEWFCAALERDGEGFARIAYVTADEPDDDGSWLRLRYLGDGSIEPLFTRYYVNESKADELDRRFANARGGAYVTVRVSRGVGVITDVGFDD